jgi:hypothetical protein
MESDLEKDLAALKDKLSAAIMEDRRQIDVLRQRINKNQAFLNFADASLNGYQPSTPAPSTIPRRPKGRPRQSGTKREAALKAIRGLNKDVFTGDDVLAEIKRRFPEIYLTRAQVSSLMWKLSTTKYGNKTFRQITPWIGGKTPAKYEKIGPPVPGEENGHAST